VGRVGEVAKVLTLVFWARNICFRKNNHKGKSREFLDLQLHQCLKPMPRCSELNR
jgi:hypothetical protein